MKIEVAFPPIIDRIRAAFPKVAEGDVIFAWGDTIYNPFAITIPPALLSHEEMHGLRQGSQVEAWWEKYLIDPEFRYNEELPAHAAELRTLHKITHDRNDRAKLAMRTAQRLIAPLYNYGVPKSLNQAICDIRWQMERL